jgi:hypothetical protein
MGIYKYYNYNCVKHIKDIIRKNCKPEEKVIDVKKLFKLFEENFNGFDEYIMDYYKTIKNSKLNPNNYEKIWKILLGYLDPMTLIALKRNEKIRVISNHTLQTALIEICKDFPHYKCIASSIDIDYKVGLSLICILNNSCIHRDKCNHNTIEEQRNILVELDKYLDEFITNKDSEARLKKDIITRLSKLENSSAFINDTIKNICVKFQVLAYDIFDVEFNIVESNFINEDDEDDPFIILNAIL